MSGEPAWRHHQHSEWLNLQPVSSKESQLSCWRPAHPCAISILSIWEQMVFPIINKLLAGTILPASDKSKPVTLFLIHFAAVPKNKMTSPCSPITFICKCGWKQSTAHLHQERSVALRPIGQLLLDCFLGAFTHNTLLFTYNNVFCCILPAGCYTGVIRVKHLISLTP